MLNKIFGIENNHPHFDNSSDWIEEGRRLYKEGKNGWGEPLDKKNNDPVKVIIEPAKLDTSNIESSNIIPVKNFEFRPTKWSEFIGQEDSKDRVKIIKEQFKRGMKAHICLSAIRGHGKSSFTKLLAKDMDLNLIERIGNTINMDSLVEILNEINTSEKQSLFFLDEIDTCTKEMIKLMNPVIESFEISGKKIKPFLFVCASINNFLLYQNNPDFLDRISHKITFTRYSIEELTTIIKQVKGQLYSEEIVSDETLTTLANNSKFNPRTAIALLEYYIVNPDIKNVLKNWTIVKDSLTKIDVDILEYLFTCKKAVGSNAIAMRCGLNQKQYEQEYEPFLYEFNYIDRCPSRIITEKGKEFLQSIKEN
jgi:Holliday junction DNA helicase RuvB